MTTVFGVDVGGSGIKGAPVDVEKGHLLTDRLRIPTPKPATPDAVFTTIEEILDQSEWDGPLGVCIPAVVVNGVAKTAANIDAAWIGTDAASLLEKRCGRPVTVINDADAAGLAEMRFGAGRGIDGVVLILTLGTGVGSALFVDGTLVPNTELGHIHYKRRVAERSVAARLVEDEDMELKRWTKRLNGYLGMIHRAFFPSRIILGGGISKEFDVWGEWLDVPCEVVPAQLRNQAGIVGAALFSAEAVGV